MNVVVNTSELFRVYDQVENLRAYSKEQAHELFDEMVEELGEDKSECHTVLTFDRGEDSHKLYLYNTDKWSMS